MSPENIGQQFVRYHGTDNEFNVGDIVAPQVSPRVLETVKNLGMEPDEHVLTPRAHATSSPLLAATYGKNVYAVTPIGEEYHHGPHRGGMGELIEHTSSVNGYRVLRKVEPNAEFRNLIPTLKFI